MASKLTILFPAALLLTLLTSTAALPPETISDAVETLSDSGYVAMSLTLNSIPASLFSETTTYATIFTPPDSVFSELGQPSLALLHFHISPFIFTSSSLRSLPSGSGIPTLSSGKYLTVTSASSSSDQISINNVKVSESPIFDDGSLIIFGIEHFFDPNFDFDSESGSNNPVQINCEKFKSNGISFSDAGNVLISRGYSVMASFLNLQLLGLQSQSQIQHTLTVFAPIDEVMVDYFNRIPEYPSLFLRHVLPCKVSWRELAEMQTGTNLKTYLNGFGVSVSKSGVSLMVNNVQIVFPDMYYSDWLVIHGVNQVFSLPKPLDYSDGEDDNTVADESDTIRTEF